MKQTKIFEIKNTIHCEDLILKFEELCKICEISNNSKFYLSHYILSSFKKLKNDNMILSKVSYERKNPEMESENNNADNLQSKSIKYDIYDKDDNIKNLLFRDSVKYETFNIYGFPTENIILVGAKFLFDNYENKTLESIYYKKFIVNRFKELETETEFYFKTERSFNVVYKNKSTFEYLHVIDWINFHFKISKCTDEKMLKAHLTETFRKWKGESNKWIEYTLLTISPPDSNVNALLTSAWYEWFEAHKETDNKQIIDEVIFEAKPIFKPEEIETIFDILKVFFSTEQQESFRSFIETGENVKEKLLFMDNGNRLADAFKQLKNSDFITGCNQIELINCICTNFNYRFRRKVKNYTLKYLESIISTNKDLCQKPILNVKGNIIQKIY